MFLCESNTFKLIRNCRCVEVDIDVNVDVKKCDYFNVYPNLFSYFLSSVPLVFSLITNTQLFSVF